MAEYYYSGQGCLFAGIRNAADGYPMGLRMMGNVPEFELSIETTKFEHKESKTGSRGIDLTIIQEKNVTFRLLLENADPYNIALGFWGTRSVVDAGTQTDQQITCYAFGLPHPLPNPNITAATYVSTTAGAATGDAANLVLDRDYTLDLIHGTITFLPPPDPLPIPLGATDSRAALNTTYFVNSSISGHVRVDAFTETSMERYLRFHGLNSVDGEAVILDAYRASLDPISGYAMINEELLQMELTGNILLDSLRPAPNNYFHQMNLGNVEGAP